MGSAAGKAATKYKESSKSGERKAYQTDKLEGSLGTYESAQPAGEEPQIQNTRTTRYRSKEPMVATILEDVVKVPSERPSDRRSSWPQIRDEKRAPSRKLSRSTSVSGEDMAELERLTSKRRGSRGESKPGSKTGGESTAGSKSKPDREETILDLVRANSKKTQPERESSKASSSLPGIKGASKTTSDRASVEIVEIDGAGADDGNTDGPGRTDKRSKTQVSLHQAHSGARASVIASKEKQDGPPPGQGYQPYDDGLCGLIAGQKVMPEGKFAQEMGIGTVVSRASTPGMVMVKMDESGREMALPVRKLRVLLDDRMVEAAKNMGKRVPGPSNESSRRPSRSSTNGAPAAGPGPTA